MLVTETGAIVNAVVVKIVDVINVDAWNGIIQECKIIVNSIILTSNISG